jgi:hypothetical protein
MLFKDGRLEVHSAHASRLKATSIVIFIAQRGEAGRLVAAPRSRIGVELTGVEVRSTSVVNAEERELEGEVELGSAWCRPNLAGRAWQLPGMDGHGLGGGVVVEVSSEIL